MTQTPAALSPTPAQYDDAIRAARESILPELAEARAQLATYEAIDTVGMGSEDRFELLDCMREVHSVIEYLEYLLPADASYYGGYLY